MAKLKSKGKQERRKNVNKRVTKHRAFVKKVKEDVNRTLDRLNEGDNVDLVDAPASRDDDDSATSDVSSVAGPSSVQSPLRVRF